MRTRLAPTPSGYLHLGNILSFVCTLDLARKSGARVLLRIDDLDRERVTPAYLQDIFDTLDFLELPYDEGPRNVADFNAAFSQQHRMHLYRQALEQLRHQPEVFACTCSRSQILQYTADGNYPGTCRSKKLALHELGAAWRVHTPDDTNLVVNTWEGRQTIAAFPKSIRNFVIRKKDGDPAYQLASLIDDDYFGVDLVVRGADLWPSTLAQLYLAQLINKPAFAGTTFLHHPLVRNAAGEKLSKSAGSTSVFGLRKEGKTKAEIYQLIASWCGAVAPVNDWQSLARVLAPLQWGNFQPTPLVS